MKNHPASAHEDHPFNETQDIKEHGLKEESAESACLRTKSLTGATDTDLVVAKIDQASALLAEAKTAQDAKQIADMAHAAKIYAVRQRRSKRVIQHAHAIMVKAERLMGEFLKTSPKAKGTRGQLKGRDSSGGAVEEPPEDEIPTLESLEITKKESASAQFLADLAEQNPALYEKVENGELSVNRAVEAVRKHQREKDRIEAAKDAPVNDQIIIGDFREHADRIANGSLSLIFTDLPYDLRSIDLYGDLGKFAAAKLAEGGSLLCYVGHVQLQHALNAFSEHLRFWWICACVHADSKALMREYGIRVGWKPMLWFVKGTRDDKSRIVQDTFSGGREKDDHDWQQAEAEADYWLKNLCPKGGLICDPFLGAGTTAKAAEKLGLAWIGVEIDPVAAKIAAGRLSAAKINRQEELFNS